VLPLEPADWAAWLTGDEGTARALMRVPPVDRFDGAVTAETDARLRAQAATPRTAPPADLFGA
jgi:hypothetical protein